MDVHTIKAKLDEAMAPVKSVGECADIEQHLLACTTCLDKIDDLFRDHPAVMCALLGDEAEMQLHGIVMNMLRLRVSNDDSGKNLLSWTDTINALLVALVAQEVES